MSVIVSVTFGAMKAPQRVNDQDLHRINDCFSHRDDELLSDAGVVHKNCG